MIDIIIIFKNWVFYLNNMLEINYADYKTPYISYDAGIKFQIEIRLYVTHYFFNFLYIPHVACILCIILSMYIFVIELHRYIFIKKKLALCENRENQIH